MKKTIIIIIIIFIFPVLVLAFNHPLDISLDKNEFKPGEMIDFTVKFNNISNQPIKGLLSCSITFAQTEEYPPMPFGLEFELAPNESTEVLDCSMSVGEAMPAGLYFAEAEVFDQGGHTIMKDRKQIIVSGTKKELEADLHICADENCQKKKAVFIAGEQVFLHLDSKIPDLNVGASINGRDITFLDDNYVFTAETEGSYSVIIDLSKTGYIDSSISRDFAVISAPAQIESKSICIDDGICTAEEKANNCPEDCQDQKYQKKNMAQAQTQSKAEKINYILIFLGLALAIILTVGLIMFLNNKNNNNN